FEKYSESFSVDQRLLLYDLEVNRAYVNALGQAGVLAEGDVRRLKRGLEAIRRRAGDGRAARPGGSAEDVHTWVEERLAREIGPVARKLRTGRSRNDLVATETRLYTKSEIRRLESAVVVLMEAFVRQARRCFDMVMPGYTHLQPAQPVLLSHY